MWKHHFRWPRLCGGPLSKVEAAWSRAGVTEAQGFVLLQAGLLPLTELFTELSAGPVSATPEVASDGGNWAPVFSLGSSTAAGNGLPSAPSESWQ
jgi:hypothetical protein